MDDGERDRRVIAIMERQQQRIRATDNILRLLAEVEQEEAISGIIKTLCYVHAGFMPPIDETVSPFIMARLTTEDAAECTAILARVLNDRTAITLTDAYNAPRPWQAASYPTPILTADEASEQAARHSIAYATGELEE